MTRLRLTLAVLGASALVYGSITLLHSASGRLWQLGVWLLAVLLLHDLVLAPVVIVVGWSLARIVPARVRAYVQGYLLAAGLVSVTTSVLIARRGRSPHGSTLLVQNYAAHLAWILLAMLGATVVLYVLRGRRAQRAISSMKQRSSAHHSSAT